MKHKHNDRECEVCGARLTRFAGLTTCDPFCYRAKAAGRTRGKQIRIELMLAALQPWSPAKAKSPFDYDPSNNYNEPSEAVA